MVLYHLLGQWLAHYKQTRHWELNYLIFFECQVLTTLISTRQMKILKPSLGRGFNHYSLFHSWGHGGTGRLSTLGDLASKPCTEATYSSLEVLTPCALARISGRYLTKYLGTGNKSENLNSPCWSAGEDQTASPLIRRFSKCDPGNSGGPWDIFGGVCKVKTIFIIKEDVIWFFSLASFFFSLNVWWNFQEAIGYMASQKTKCRRRYENPAIFS